jgi:hypothetical protein
MKKLLKPGGAMFAAAVMLLLWQPLFTCTSILVSKGASKNAAGIITYSCDGEFLPRLRLTPAADYAAVPGSD